MKLFSTHIARFLQIGFLASILIFSPCSLSQAANEKIDSSIIFSASGFSGQTVSGGDVVKLTATRKNFDVSVGGIKLVAGLGLNAWASFTGTKDHAVLIGKLPLLESEVNDFLGTALNAGLDVTSIHNAFIFDNPRVMALHFSGVGDQKKLASAAGVLLKKFVASRVHKEPKLAQVILKKNTLDLERINTILWKGEFSDGAYRVSTGKGTELAGVAVGDSMGVNSWASFAGSNDHAVVTGDIGMLETEVRNVLKALIVAHINVTSIHLHVESETPRVVFVHYWGVGKLEDLARGVKAALAVEKSFRGST